MRQQNEGMPQHLSGVIFQHHGKYGKIYLFKGNQGDAGLKQTFAKYSDPSRDCSKMRACLNI